MPIIRVDYVATKKKQALIALGCKDVKIYPQGLSDALHQSTQHYC